MSKLVGTKTVEVPVSDLANYVVPVYNKPSNLYPEYGGQFNQAAGFWQGVNLGNIISGTASFLDGTASYAATASSVGGNIGQTTNITYDANFAVNIVDNNSNGRISIGPYSSGPTLHMGDANNDYFNIISQTNGETLMQTSQGNVLKIALSKNNPYSYAIFGNNAYEGVDETLTIESGHLNVRGNNAIMCDSFLPKDGTTANPITFNTSKLVVTGSVDASDGFTGSLQGTASYATSASYAVSSSKVEGIKILSTDENDPAGLYGIIKIGTENTAPYLSLSGSFDPNIFPSGEGIYIGTYAANKHSGSNNVFIGNYAALNEEGNGSANIFIGTNPTFGPLGGNINNSIVIAQDWHSAGDNTITIGSPNYYNTYIYGQIHGTIDNAISASYVPYAQNGASSGPSDPITLGSVKWFLIGSGNPYNPMENDPIGHPLTKSVLPFDYTYTPGPDYFEPMGGATITSTGSFDLNSIIYQITPNNSSSFILGKLAGNPIVPMGQPIVVNVGDRIFFQDQKANAHQGIYVVTDTGGPSSPFVLTRADDYHTSAQAAYFYNINLENTSYYARNSKYDISDGQGHNGTYIGFSIAQNGGFASGYGAMATAMDSFAIGPYSLTQPTELNANDFGSMAIGWGAYASNGMTVIAANGSGTSSINNTPVKDVGGAAVVQGVTNDRTTDFTLSYLDLGKWIPCVGNIVATLPTYNDSNVQYSNIPFGSKFYFSTYDNSSTITLATGSGVNIYGETTVSGNRVLTVVKTDNNTWYGYSSYSPTASYAATSSYLAPANISVMPTDTTINVNVDFTSGSWMDYSFDYYVTDIYFTGSNYVPGTTKTIRVKNTDTGSNQTTLHFPDTWYVQNTGWNPRSDVYVQSNETAILTVYCFGTQDSDITVTGQKGVIV